MATSFRTEFGGPSSSRATQRLGASTFKSPRVIKPPTAQVEICATAFPASVLAGPLVAVGANRPALRIDHAEAVAGGRFHHPPPLHERDALRAQRLEPAHLGVQVVALDVQMDPARVRDLLQEHHRLLGAGAQLAIGAALGRDLRDGAAQRPAPEVRRAVDVGGPAIDDEGRQLALVHVALLAAVRRANTSWLVELHAE